MKLGLKLPADYRKFIDTYGSGLFADFYMVYNPFASSELINLIVCVNRVCGYNRTSQTSNPSRFPYPYFPEPNGLLPWGRDENGNDYFWLRKGSPATWQVVQDSNRGSGILLQPYTMTGFLAGVLEGKVKALASHYPNSESHTFTQWKPITHEAQS